MVDAPDLKSGTYGVRVQVLLWVYGNWSVPNAVLRYSQPYNLIYAFEPGSTFYNLINILYMGHTSY